MFYKTAQCSITKLRSSKITKLRKKITNLRRNYKTAQNNYKSTQKLQICAKITKLRITTRINVKFLSNLLDVNINIYLEIQDIIKDKKYYDTVT